MEIRLKQAFIGVAIVASLAIAGCSTDENPITPAKMSEIRKQEADQRANFNPDVNQPKGP